MIPDSLRNLDIGFHNIKKYDKLVGNKISLKYGRVGVSMAATEEEE